MSESSLKKGRYTRFSNKIGLVDSNTGGFINNAPEVVLNFPFKDTVLEAGMTKEDAGREERFLHNEIDAKDIDTLFDPKVLTDFRYIDKDGERKLTKDDDIEFFDENGELKQNLLIKGNNLLALHTIKEKLAGKVKLIYIDPPYNTGNDSFKYNDSFNHSSWLTFMKNRLEEAKELLCKDSLIFIECDYKEDAYLKVLCDEIFERDNFVNAVTVQSSTPSGTKLAHRDRTILKTKDTILVYKKGEPKINPQYTASDNLTNFNYWFETTNTGDIKIRNLKDVLVEKGLLSKTQHIEEVKMSSNQPFEKFIIENSSRIFRKQPSLPDDMKQKSKKDPSRVLSYNDNGVTRYCQNGYRFAFLSDGIRTINGEKKVTQLVCDIWTDISFHGTQYEGEVDLPAGKKPEALLQRIIEMATNPGDIVLDFFAGSGTTMAVAMKIGRKWVGIEQMDYIETKTKKRLKGVISGEQGGISKAIGWQGGGSFVYFELKKYNQDFIDKIMEAASTSELEEVYEEMQKNAFLKFWFDKKEFEKDENFRKLDIYERKQKLVDILDENQFYLNYDEMEDSKYHVTKDEKALTNRFYQESDNAREVEYAEE